MFQTTPKRPAAGKVIDTGHDFAQLNEILPHPIYGWMTWICVLNPSTETIDSMEEKGFFEEAYQAVVMNIEKRLEKIRVTQNDSSYLRLN